MLGKMSGGEYVLGGDMTGPQHCYSMMSLSLITEVSVIALGCILKSKEFPAIRNHSDSCKTDIM